MVRLEFVSLVSSGSGSRRSGLESPDCVSFKTPAQGTPSVIFPVLRAEAQRKDS